MGGDGGDFEGVQFLFGGDKVESARFLLAVDRVCFNGLLQSEEELLEGFCVEAGSHFNGDNGVEELLEKDVIDRFTQS